MLCIAKEEKSIRRREGRYKKTSRGGRIYAQEGGNQFPSPTRKKKRQRWCKCQKVKKKCRQEDPPSSSPIGALSVRPSVCVCMCVRFHSVNSSIFANQGYHQEQEKKVVAISKEASWYTVLAPALKTAPWIRVSDS